MDDVGLFSEDFAEASLLLRPRFEYRKVGDLEGANALTVRARSGLLLGKGAPVSLFAQVEATKALIDDYQSNPLGGPQTQPFNPGYSVIGDPEHEELNQLWAKINPIEGFAAACLAADAECSACPLGLDECMPSVSMRSSSVTGQLTRLSVLSTCSQ